MTYPRIVPIGSLPRLERRHRDRPEHGAAQPALRRPHTSVDANSMLMSADRVLRCWTRARASPRGCARCDSGLAFIEFAMALPVLSTLGLCGLETANLAMAHLRVSNIAMLTADNASRVRDSIDEANVIELVHRRQDDRRQYRFPPERPDHPVEHRAQHGRRRRRQHRPVDPLAALRRRAASSPRDYGGAGHRPEQCDRCRRFGAGGQPDLGNVRHRGDGGRGRVRLSAAGLRMRSSGQRIIRYESAFNVRQRTNQALNNAGSLTPPRCAPATLRQS